MGRHGLNDRINVTNSTLASLQASVTAIVNEKDAKLVAANKLITEQGEKINTLEAEQATLKKELIAQKSGQTTMENALREETKALKTELAAQTSKNETQKCETDTKIRQLEENLHTLTVKNHELLEMLSRLVTRLNSVKEGSEKCSFFGGESEVDMYDLPDLNDLATELEKKLDD